MNNRIGDNLTHFGGNEKLVEAFSNFHVRFVLIGGLAVSWYCSERVADDMDLLIEPTSENSERVAGALGSLGLSGFNVSSFEVLGRQFRIKDGQYYAELFTPESQGLTFSQIEANANTGNLFHIPVRIAAVNDLIVMKRRAIAIGEKVEKHIKDIELLEKCDR